MAMTLVVKGSFKDVKRACEDHGVIPQSIIWNARFNECIVVVYVPVAWSTLAAWFCDTDGQAPFPSGTLLWYGPRN